MFYFCAEKLLVGIKEIIFTNIYRVPAMSQNLRHQQQNTLRMNYLKFDEREMLDLLLDFPPIHLKRFAFQTLFSFCSSTTILSSKPFPKSTECLQSANLAQNHGKKYQIERRVKSKKLLNAAV